MEIDTIKLIDINGDKENERHVLDSYDAVFYWIRERFKEQEQKKEQKYIDLRNVIIKLQEDYYEEELAPYSLFDIRGLAEKDINQEIFVSSEDKERYGVKFQIKFDYSIVYYFYFPNTVFQGKVSFLGTQFFGNVKLEKSVFQEEVDFIRLFIYRIFIDTYKIGFHSGYAGFNYITFKKEVIFRDLDLIKNSDIHFNNNIYEKIVNFTKCSIKTEDSNNCYDFKNSIFKGDVFFNGCSFSCNDGVNKNIISNIDFSGSSFYKQLEIKEHFIGNILMQNCQFNDSVNIVNNEYNDNANLDFLYSTIHSLFFIDSDLLDKNGKLTLFKNKISFNKSLIKESAVVSLRNINNKNDNNGELDFSYASVLGTITIQDSNLKMICLEKATLVGNLNIESVDTEYDCRESITKVKNEFIKHNDIINSLAYKAKELDFYLKDDSSSNIINSKNNKFESRFKKLSVSFWGQVILIVLLFPLLFVSLLPLKKHSWIRENTLLFLNKLSNNFGMSWNKGVVFTCSVAFVFFFFINYFGIENNERFFEFGWESFKSFGEVWKSYLSVLNVLNFKDSLNGIHLNSIGETLFFLSKIFISYGIYQTISAFRKYGK